MLRILVLAVLVLAVTGCVPGDGRHDPDEPANFVWGIWHGWIAPISLIISAFNPERAIYETHNTGFWYDLGFYVAVIAGFGSVSLTRKKGGGGDRHRGPGRPD